MTVPPPSVPLLLGGREFAAGRLLVMAVLEQAPAAPRARHAAAADQVAAAVAEGADIVDLGGLRGDPEVGAAEEAGRVVPFVAEVRAAHPELVISVETWRSEVAEEACAAGADLLRDAWPGRDPKLADVAARQAAGLVCAHGGDLPPGAPVHRQAYGRTAEGVVDDVLTALMHQARRATDAGVPAASLLVDPGHDRGKNTWHGLTLARRTDAVVSLGHPVLMSLSRQDFVGETLDLPAAERLEGALAATAIAAWQGAKVFRTHDVAATRRTLDMVASIRGDRPPARAVRGLA